MATDPLLQEGQTGEREREIRGGMRMSVCVLIYLDFPEVDRLADELVVLRQLLAGGQLDEDFTQLAPIAAVK